MGEAILALSYFCLGKYEESNDLKLKLLSNPLAPYYSLVRTIRNQSSATK